MANIHEDRDNLIGNLEAPKSLSSRPIYAKFTARTFAIITISLPFISFISCIFFSWLMHFDSATATHCNVPNYLPSISAAIGGYSPEKYIWRIGIALHSTPRYLVAFLYRHHHMNILESSKWSHKLPNILCFLNVVEVSSLVGLSYISSTENYDAHEKLFISFMTCSLLYMLIMNGLGKSCLRPQSSLMECKSLRYKTIFFLINILSIFMAVYFFFRHNWHCEPGVYSLFCLCEYMVVLSNMGFHMTAYWDFYEHIFVITDTFGIYGSLPK